MPENESVRGLTALTGLLLGLTKSRQTHKSSTHHMKLNPPSLDRVPSKMRLAFCLALGAVVMLASISMASPDEPASQGHSLSYWLEHYSLRGSDADRKIAEKAEIAIREIGTNALPALLVWLRYEPSQTKTNIQHFLAHLRRSSYGRWVPASLTYDHGVPPAQVGFMVLGPAAAEAIPELEKIANDATNPIPAARAMADLSRRVVE